MARRRIFGVTTCKSIGTQRDFAPSFYVDANTPAEVRRYTRARPYGSTIKRVYVRSIPVAEVPEGAVVEVVS